MGKSKHNNNTSRKPDGIIMKIEHLALWAEDLEKLKHFYMQYFNATANTKYENKKKGFSSYFLSFSSGTRLEIMTMDSVPITKNSPYQQATGWAHLAFSAGSELAVDELTEKLKKDGYQVLDGPRRTGDGYYESCVLDPENNRLEITV